MRAYPWLATGLTLALALHLVCAGVAPMTTLYKRNSEEKYEPGELLLELDLDWVLVIRI